MKKRVVIPDTRIMVLHFISVTAISIQVQLPTFDVVVVQVPIDFIVGALMPEIQVRL